MGFTTPCFIRKNTPELREKLKGLGYSHGKPKYYADNDDNKYDFIMCHNGKFFLLSQENHVIRNGHPLKKYGSIDCGTNEELFLAIASLRDDTDKSQWFTDGYLWFKCGDEMCDEHIKYYFSMYSRLFHKATVNELIEHFKDKKEQLCVE